MGEYCIPDTSSTPPTTEAEPGWFTPVAVVVAVVAVAPETVLLATEADETTDAIAELFRNICQGTNRAGHWYSSRMMNELTQSAPGWIEVMIEFGREMMKAAGRADDVCFVQRSDPEAENVRKYVKCMDVNVQTNVLKVRTQVSDRRPLQLVRNA